MKSLRPHYLSVSIISYNMGFVVLGAALLMIIPLATSLALH